MFSYYWNYSTKNSAYRNKKNRWFQIQMFFYNQIERFLNIWDFVLRLKRNHYLVNEFWHIKKLKSIIFCCCLSSPILRSNIFFNITSHAIENLIEIIENKRILRFSLNKMQFSILWYVFMKYFIIYIVSAVVILRIYFCTWILKKLIIQIKTFNIS